MRARLLFLFAAALSPTFAAAQEAEINAEIFRPSAGDGFFGVRGARLIAPFSFSAGAFFNYAEDPLVLVDADGNVSAKVIDVQSAIDLVAAVGLSKFLELDLALPVSPLLAGDADNGVNGGVAIAGGTVGDLRLGLRGAILRGDEAGEGFLLSFAPEVSLPTGDGAKLFGAVGPSVFLPVAAGFKRGKLSVGLAAGPRLQQPTEILGVTVGSALALGLGGSYALSSKVAVLGEADAALSLVAEDGAEAAVTSPAELRAGVRLNVAKGISVPVGVGVALGAGIGAPVFRALAGVVFSLERGEGRATDLDGDGLVGGADKCPKEAEDEDGFEDENGCPDKDNDKDGVADSDDKCINEPGEAATKGCPNVDGDNDTIVDDLDDCPSEAGVASAKGCPDKDGDAFTDKLDACPEEAGVPSAKGCPDKDGDAIADAEDACADKPGPADTKGCPDTDGDKLADNEDACPEKAGAVEAKGCPDTDGDKFTDEVDICPTEPEDGSKKGGANPKDGCPEKTKAVFAGDKIVILDKIFFDTKKAKIQKKSFKVLDAVAGVMIAHPEARVLIGGHTDDVGDDAKNLKLSQERAEEVKKYLVKKGVDEARLSAEGFGETAPLVPIEGKKGKEAKAAREKNRRVEFSVVPAPSSAPQP
jgi:OmpA-OmpF porin, OOP family